jgi:hypothetical protein
LRGRQRVCDALPVCPPGGAWCPSIEKVKKEQEEWGRRDGERQKSRRAARRVACSLWEEAKWREKGTLEDEKRERGRERGIERFYA